MRPKNEERKIEVYRFVTDFIRERGVCPTTVEIGSSLGMAKSTVSKYMTRLAEEGTVKKFIRDNSRSLAYQIIKDDHCHNHLHLKCTKCGRLFHMDEKLSDELMSRVIAMSDFRINEDETVLFGKCARCFG